MNAKQAAKLLKTAGFRLESTTAKTVQRWRLGDIVVGVPNRSDIQEHAIRRALRHAGTQKTAVQVCAIPGCQRQATGWNNKCSEHWHAQCAGFPAGL